MPNNGVDCHVAIVGAGPYGLAAAAHLKAARVETRTFGQPMEFWSCHMPKGMLLRSSPDCSQIADPSHHLTLRRWRDQYHVPETKPLPIGDFVGYGRWYQQHAVPDLERARIERIEKTNGHFTMLTEHGETVRAKRVVVAAGIAPFAWRPAPFDALPSSLASHSCDHADLGRFRGQRVVVIGGGQSALESAALLAEAGAKEVEVVVRAPSIHWLSSRPSDARGLAALVKQARHALRPLVRPNFDIMGPRIVSWLLAAPRLFRRAPRPLRKKLMAAAVRPAGAGWLVPRLQGVRLTTGRSVALAHERGSQVYVRLEDGSERYVDHLMMATGYRVDVRNYPFLAPDIAQRLRVTNGYPDLEPGLESSIPGLHFLGTPASHTFGPLTRFVVGSGYAARALTFHIFDQARRRAAS